MATAIESDLLAFYRTKCVHCKKMEPLIERLEIETNLKVQRLRSGTTKLMHNSCESMTRDFVEEHPFFYNKKTGERLCGIKDYEILKMGIWQ